MKKGLFLILCSVIALALTACGKKTTTVGNTTTAGGTTTAGQNQSTTAGATTSAPDTVAPEITGNVDRMCSVGEEINLLEGIVALDDVDGDISDKVTVSIMPEIEGENGVVTPTEQGDYEVAYTVTDAAGNLGEAFCTLTVNPKFADKVVYKEFPFGLAEDSPFSTWHFDGLEVTDTVSKGNYVIAGKSDAEAWHIKFEGKTKTMAAADYEVKYEFTSNVAGKIKFEAYDVTTSNETNVKVGHNELSFKFSATQAKNEQGFCLQLGMLPTDFELQFSKITIIESVGADVWAKVVSGVNFTTEGVVTSKFDNGSQGTVATEANQAVMTINKGSNGNGVWETKLSIIPGVDLAKGVKYRISVDFLAEKDIKNFEVCYGSGTDEKGVGALYGQKATAGVKQTISYITTLEAAKDNLVILFQLGEQNTKGDSNVITVSNVKIDRIVTEDETVFDTHTYTTGRNGNLSTRFWEGSAGSWTLNEDATEATFNITKPSNAGNVWEIGAIVGLGVGVEKGRPYKVSIEVLSDFNIEGVEALLRTVGQEDNQGGQYGINLVAGQTTKIEFEFTPEKDITKPGVHFQIGQAPAGTIKFTNLTLVALGGTKESTEESYTFAPVGFGTYNDPGNGEGYLYTENGKLIYEIAKLAVVDWHNKLYISDLVLESDKIYTIEFVGKADKEISCAFFLNVAGKWDPRVSEEAVFTTESQKFEFQTPVFAADMKFEVLFQFGSDVNQKLGDAKIEIEYIIIYSQDVE